MEKNTWYNILVTEENDTAEIFIFDEIGLFGISAAEFVRDFKAIAKDNIIIHVNSPGGDVFDGVAIHNIIQGSKKNTTSLIEGLASSISTVIAIAANKVKMTDNSLFMIHNPSSFAFGGEEDFKKSADNLAKVKEVLITSYANRTGLSRDEISDLMNEEEFLSAAEAKKKGFVDEVIKGQKVAAFFDLKKFNFKNSNKYDLIKNISQDPIDEKLKNKNNEQWIKDAAAAAALDYLEKENKTKIKNQNTNQNKNSEADMDAEELKEKNPELYNQIFNSGKDTGNTEGAEKEAKRIAAIHDLGITGHDKILNAALADNETQAADVALAVMKAEKVSNKLTLENRVAEGEDVKKVAASTGDEGDDKKIDMKTIEANAKAMADLINKKYEHQNN